MGIYQMGAIWCLLLCAVIYFRAMRIKLFYLVDNYHILVRGGNFLNHSSSVTCGAWVEPMSLMNTTAFTTARE